MRLASLSDSQEGRDEKEQLQGAKQMPDVLISILHHSGEQH